MKNYIINVDNELIIAARNFLAIYENCISEEVIRDALLILDKIITQISNQFEMFDSIFSKKRIEIENLDCSEAYKSYKISKEYKMFEKSIIRDSEADSLVERLYNFIKKNNK